MHSVEVIELGPPMELSKAKDLVEVDHGHMKKVLNHGEEKEMELGASPKAKVYQ